MHIKRTAPSFGASASQVSHTPHDNVLQSTMMWLFLTISCLMFIAAKSEENPEVSMGVVSPFLTCLVVQVTCAVMVCARHTGSVCLHRGMTPDFIRCLSPCSYVYRDLWQGFMGGFIPSQQVWSQAQSLAVCAALLLIVIQKGTVLH